MYCNSKQRSAAVLLSLSFAVSCQSVFAEGLISKVASPIGSILKPPIHAAVSILHSGSSAASSLVRPSDSSTTTISPSSGITKSVGRDYPVLEGEVSTYQQNTVVSQCVNRLVDAALANDPRTESLNNAVNHYSRLQSKVIRSVKDSINSQVPYRGFDPSIEAGNIATGENQKISSLGSAEYARQKHIDELHVKVVSSVMQIATGLGMSNKFRGQEKVTKELNNLRTLVGDDEANKAVAALEDWSNQVNLPESAFNHEAWDINQQKERTLAVVSNALNSDPVVADVLNRVHKYNHRSKFARVSARVIETALGTISLGPDFIGAGGRMALCAFQAATGGPEQDKMMKEAYLGKRLESRTNVLSEETHLSIQNYQLGALTRNAVLMAAAQAVVQQMAGPEILEQVFGNGVLQAKNNQAESL